ncbi:MAG: carboxypeptidase-like regulatory domain-containing protein [Elusimicrobiota bacterium]
MKFINVKSAVKQIRFFLFTYSPTRLFAGFSQVDLLVALLIMSVIVLCAISTFSAIGRSIIVSKTKTIANNLAQEKINALKNITYSRLIPTSENDLINYTYDNTYYPSEKLMVNNIDFTRYVTVWKACESGTEISTMSPTATDEGIKKIKIEIKWTTLDGSKTLVLYNFRDDPDREKRDGEVYGTITTTTVPTVAIANATVEVTQCPNWSSLTNADGYYLIKTTAPATINLRVSRNDYWPSTSGDIIVSANKDFQLQKKLTSPVTGYVVINTHPVISEVCASTSPSGGPGSQEWVELFNPTTWSWLISACTIYYIDEDNNSINIGRSKILPITWLTTEIPPSCYFLIANTGTIILGSGTNYTADAYYSSSCESYIESNVAGGIVLSTSLTSNKIDSVAWGKSSPPSVKNPPSKAVEGDGKNLTYGLAPNHILMRYSYKEGVSPTSCDLVNYGNGYDSNDNNTDFGYEQLGIPHNVSISKTVVSGTPAHGAIVSCDDGLSSSVIAIMEANSRNAYFSINTATGTWTILITSANYSKDVSNVVVDYVTGAAIPNATTSPSWPATDRNETILSSLANGGAISGVVKRGDVGIPIQGILVDAWSTSAITDSNGEYSLSVSVGSYTVVANPDYYDTNWTEDSESAEVTQGIAKKVDFTIYPAGWISGTTYNIVGDPLPYIVVRVTNQTAGFEKETISGSDGTYMLKGVRTGSCSVVPMLDESDSYTLSGGWTNPIDLLQGEQEINKNFNITSSWGKIEGDVSDTAIGGNIATGVLIVATTGFMPADSPPVIDSSFRTGNEIYYSTISTYDGKYEIAVCKEYTYNVKAWYIKQTTDSIQIQPTKTATVDVTNSVPTVTVNFQWP